MLLSRTTLTLAAAVLIAVMALVTFSVARPSTPPPTLVGTLMDRAAPTFALRDQSGKKVTINSLEGHPVVITFLSATCTTLCPVVANSIQRAVEELGPAGKKVAVIAITTAPEDDTHRAIMAFLRNHHAEEWHFLSAPRRVLAPIWRSYYVYVAPANAPRSMKNAHTSATYLLDGSGRERVLMAGVLDQGSVLRDLQILSGIPVAANAGLAIPAPQLGHPAPALSLRTLDGKAVSIGALRGHTVLLNFWASWCTACRSEMPLIVRWARHNPGPLTILGIDEQDSKSAGAAFARRYHAPYPILFDGSGNGASAYDIAGLPTSFLIGPDGVIRYVSEGALKPIDWQRHVAPLLRASHGS